MVTIRYGVALLASALLSWAGEAAAQTLRLQLATPRLTAGEPLRATATIVNGEATVGAWTLHAWLHAKDARAPVPRSVRRPVQVEPGAEARVDLSFPTGAGTLGGSYELRVELVGKGYHVLARTAEPIVIEGPRAMKLELRVCRDEACKEPGRLFAQGETIYLSHLASAAAPSIEAFLTTPGGRKPLVLPAQLRADQVGDYQLEARASQAGFQPARSTVMFGVVARKPLLEAAP